jgi:hypothetical protein
VPTCRAVTYCGWVPGSNATVDWSKLGLTYLVVFQSSGDHDRELYPPLQDSAIAQVTSNESPSDVADAGRTGVIISFSIAGTLRRRWRQCNEHIGDLDATMHILALVSPLHLFRADDRTLIASDRMTGTWNFRSFPATWPMAIPIGGGSENSIKSVRKAAKSCQKLLPLTHTLIHFCPPLAAFDVMDSFFYTSTETFGDHTPVDREDGGSGGASYCVIA